MLKSEIVDDESELFLSAASPDEENVKQEGNALSPAPASMETAMKTKTQFVLPSLASVIFEPFEWLQMLSSRLDSTFVLAVVLVYGLSRGFASSVFNVVSDYYWKDVQRVQPSAVQLFIGLYYIPWVLKPVWGLLTDVFPVRGYKRRPYFILAGIVGSGSALVLALSGRLAIVVALVLLIGITAGVAIADVTIDACIARKSIEIKSLAPDIQSLCMFCSSVGALLGYSSSGFFVHHIGPQGSLGLLAMPAAAMVALGFVIKETRTLNEIQCEKKNVRNSNF